MQISFYCVQSRLARITDTEWGDIGFVKKNASENIYVFPDAIKFAYDTILRQNE